MPQELRQTAILVGAVVACLPFGTNQGCATNGTHCRVCDGPCVRLALVQVDAYNLGNNLTALLHQQVVSLTNIQLGHEIGIVQGSTLDRGAAKPHRLHVGHRGHHSGAPHLIGYLQQWGADSLCLKLICNGPTGRLGCHAQAVPKGGLVDLDNHAVDAERKVPAGRVPVVDKGLYLVYVLALADIGLDLKAHLLGSLQTAVMGTVLGRKACVAVGKHHKVHAEHKLTLGTFGRIL